MHLAEFPRVSSLIGRNMSSVEAEQESTELLDRESFGVFGAVGVVCMVV